ncbi:hypothetical protein DASB73_014770 [Starmerella bacillaris]|uniref:Uncharacterized protein n=1 Tax=Starmerella bacillaris TaxID=1247836 RepID=A0AAV5RGA3_STABA|nr:hypothetical protein DASB73_014770 [Starmerella bacillaris]
MKKKAGPERVCYLAQLAHITPSPVLARMYGTAMTAVARKAVIRVNATTKQRFCKKCWAPRNTETCKWRVIDESKKKNRPVLVCECSCGNVSRRHLF